MNKFIDRIVQLNELDSSKIYHSKYYFDDNDIDTVEVEGTTATLKYLCSRFTISKIIYNEDTQTFKYELLLQTPKGEEEVVEEKSIFTSRKLDNLIQKGFSFDPDRAKEVQKLAQLQEENARLVTEYSYIGFKNNRFWGFPRDEDSICVSRIKLERSSQFDKAKLNELAYLVHRTKSNKDKFQYSLSEVKANFDYAAMITEQTKKIEQRSAYTIKSRLDLLKIGAITSKQLIDELSGSDYAQYKRKIDDIERLRLERAADKWREDMKAKGVTVKVLWIYGETGTGKSSVAKELADRLGQAFYMSGSSKDLFQEYNGEHTIILDELRPNTIPYQDFLRITDPHGMTETHTAAPSRYYDKALAADTVIITTPYSPYAFYQEMFDSPAKRRNDPFAQIERRITLTVMCTEDLICEVDFHSTNNGSFIVNSRNNPYSEKNRPQQTTDRNALAKLLFGDEGSEQDEKATDGGNHI